MNVRKVVVMLLPPPPPRRPGPPGPLVSGVFTEYKYAEFWRTLIEKTQAVLLKSGLLHRHRNMCWPFSPGRDTPVGGGATKTRQFPQRQKHSCRESGIQDLFSRDFPIVLSLAV